MQDRQLAVQEFRSFGLRVSGLILKPGALNPAYNDIGCHQLEILPQLGSCAGN